MARLADFVAAQDPVWPNILRELTAGRKQSHWMWFVFPQLAALGRSATAKRFGLSNLDEARAYLAHPVLGPRLDECTGLILTHAGTDPVTFMGQIDALKLRSSMTLFEAANPTRTAFSRVLETFLRASAAP